MVHESGRLTLHDICQNIGHHGIIIMVNKYHGTFFFFTVVL